MEEPKNTLPSLSSLAGKAMSQLSKRAILVTIGVCITIATLGAIFLFFPIQNKLKTFSSDTRSALTQRNQELVRSSVEQAAGNMIRLLGAAENAVQQITSTLESPKTISNNGIIPVESEFKPGGGLTATLKKTEGYQSRVTFDFPQIKTTDPIDERELGVLWPSFLAISKPLHNFHPELKWLYLGTKHGSFLVFPSSPEIPKDFDPRVRPWFQEALKQKRLVWTSPYFTAGGNDLVLTAAQPVRYGKHAGSVVGVDLVMADVINNLLATPYCAKCTFYLINQSGEILGKRGDKTMGDTWTEAPKARQLSEDLSGFMTPGSATQVSNWLNGEKPEEVVPSLSRSPKAKMLNPKSSELSFFYAPIESLGWKLVGVTSQTDVGADGDQVFASITSLFSTLKTVGLTLVVTLICFLAGLLLLFSRMVRVTLRKSLQPSLDQMSELGTTLDHLKMEPASGDVVAFDRASLVREHSAMVSAIRRMLGRLNKEAKEQQDLRVQAEVGAQAKQVAHNIRSPLEALELILPQLGEVPEDKRRIMRNALREIRDLTNMVKAKGTEVSIEPQLTSTKGRTNFTRLMLLPLIDSVISERRSAFPKAQIELEAAAAEISSGLFIHANRTDFRSVISNLINNAIEATEHLSGHVTISVCKSNDRATITIKDNGKGIHPSLLPVLGTEGRTFGKTNGSGLGLFHAKQTLSAMSGTFAVDSLEGNGTSVTLTVPLAAPPTWFTESIVIPPDSELGILDDNDSIHGVWDYRLTRLPEPMPGLRVQHFHKINDLKDWHLKAQSEKSRVYLVDYEIHDDPKNGLDIIEELGIAANSYLVTGHSDESDVLKRAEWLGVKVVPKELACNIPIVSESRSL